MIMARGTDDQLLLPVNPLFLWFSLFAALVFNMLPFGRVAAMPDVLALTLVEQALQILPLFIASHAVSLVVRLLSSGSFPGWTLLLAPLFEAMLWPVVTMLLLAPQRRAPDRDEQRPL